MLPAISKEEGKLMEFLNDLLHNTVFMAAATGWLVAQILKTIIYTFLNRKFDP